MQNQEPQRILGKLIAQELTSTELEKVAGARWVGVSGPSASGTDACYAGNDVQNYWVY
jgi:hypothetical protein